MTDLRDPVGGQRSPWVLEQLWRTGKGVEDSGPWGMVVLSPLGFRNGYVHLPGGHPWEGKGYDDIDVQVQVHGGLTFAGEYPADQLANGDGVPAGWWIGFDCAHWPDAPEPDVWARSSGGGDWKLGDEDAHVWTTAEVMGQVEFLAGQVRAAYWQRT